MKLIGDYEFKAARQVVWDTLLTPEALKAAIPGCKKLTLVGEDEYKADLSIGFAAIRGEYSGDVKLEDKEPYHYKMLIEGSGGPAGYIKSVGYIELVEAGEKTILKYDLDAEIGGKMAAVGQRVLGGVAKVLMGQFWKAMGKEVAKNISKES